MCQGCWERSCVCGREGSAEGIEKFLQQVITSFFPYSPILSQATIESVLISLTHKTLIVLFQGGRRKQKEETYGEMSEVSVKVLVMIGTNGEVHLCNLIFPWSFP